MKKFYIHKNIPVVFAEPLQNQEVSIENVIKTVNKKIPKHFFHSIDGVYVGHLPEFDKRKINALYSDGAIYTTSYQDSDMDMIDDIVHELAHATEKQYGQEIYGDGVLEEEFVKKRVELFNRLKTDKHPVKLQDFLQTNFNVEFDFFLLKEIGYPTLKKYIGGLFNSCYSATCLSEYYAVNFTDYFLYDRDSVERNCPVVYLKIINITEGESNEN